MAEVLITFEHVTSAITRKYIASEVQVSLEVEGDEYTLLNDTIDQDARKVRLVFEVSTVFEQTTGTPLSANDLWLDIVLATQVINFKPNDADADAVVSVYADTTAPPVFYQRVGTRVERKQGMRFKSRSVYDPDDALLRHFADLTP